MRSRGRPVLAVVTVLVLAYAVWSQRTALATFDWSLSPVALLGAVALFAVAPLLQAATFVLGLRRLDVAAPAAPTLRVWARSFLLRYEPSGALGFAYRVRVRERMGASTAEVLTVTGYEQLAVVAGGALAAVAGFLAAGVAPPWLALALLGGVLAVAVAVRPAFLGSWLSRRLAARGIRTAGLLRGRELAGLIALDAAGWTVTALGAGVLAGALGLGDLDPYLLLGAYALSWLLGVLVPLAPGGLGLRDGSLVAALAASVGTGPATALALALRLVSFAGELLAVAVVEAGAAVAGAHRAPRANVRRPGPGAPRTDVRAAAAAAAGGTIVVVPTYEEALALPAFVDRFAATGMQMLVVDDASPDGTGALAEALRADGRPWLHVLHREGKDGLGVAYRAGFAWCLQRGYEVIGQMDADGSHPPEKLGELLACLQERDADLVIANRYAPGGGTSGWSRGRRVLSRVGCTGSRLLLGLPFDDLSGGFKLWRASCLAAMDLDAMLATGYAFQVETTQLAYLMGKRIEEVPFVFAERVAGRSKMSAAVSLEGVRVTLALRRRGRAGHRRGPRPLAL